MFSNASYDRLLAAEGSQSAVLAASNSTVAPYADEFLQYDSQQRVTQLVTQGAGCSVCSAGLGTYTYSYTQSVNAQGYNNWATETIETLPNGTQNTYFANFAGETLLQDQYVPSTGQHFLTDYQYDTAGRLIEQANPSAVTGYNSADANLGVTLNSSSGLINLTDYYSTTTATTSVAGGVAGYQEDTKIEQGTGGTPVLQSTTTYILNTDGSGNTIVETAASTVYSTTTATGPSSAGAETTSFSYTFYSGTNQIEDETTSLPAVTDQNSGHTSVTDTTTTIYNQLGQDVWDQDPDGNIGYTAYDAGTGAVTETIQDVSAAEASSLGMPGSLTVSSGSHLNLITTFQVDDQGRTTEETDPNGNATFTIYDDVNREVRVYTGFIDNGDGTYSQESDGLPPTQVIRTDLANNYTETLTMSATPTVDGTTGAPLGTEGISNLQSLSRSIMNSAGQVVEQDDYFDLTGVTYSTSSVHLGTLNVNYYKTTRQYDDLGNLDKTVNPNGTITRIVRDGLEREISVWVGTNDTPASGFWSPTNNTGTSNMVELTATVYDNGFVGDGNITGELAFPAGASYSNVQDTAMFYNWRDELVATKSGILLSSFSSENLTGELTDGTNRPLTYYTLDNLGEVSDVSVFNGNGLTVTYTAGVPDQPAASLLRSETTYAYDALGREYQTSQYDVDQSSGAINGSNTETTSSLFDPNGNDIAATDALANTTEYVYDGAGRETEMIQPSPDGVAADPTTLYGYDGNGNETSITDPLLNVTSYVFDAANRQTEEIDPSPDGVAADPTIFYSYDAAGNLGSETDPDGNTTSYVHDALGRETSQTDSLSNSTLYVYDGDNNLTQTTDADGQVTADTYNYLNQLTQENWSNSSSTLVNTLNYSYDNLGEMLTAADDSSSYTFTYNSLGQQSSNDNNGSGPSGTTGTPGVPDVLLNSTFDTAGNRTALDATIGGTADFQNSFAFDSFGRERQVAQQGATGGNAVADKLVNFTYNANGQFTEIDRYSDLAGTSLVATSVYGYDNDSRITSLEHSNGSTTFANYAWTYDADGWVSGVTNSVYTSEDAAYTYDHDGQLTAANYVNDTALNQSYSYDANGNPTKSGDTLNPNSNQLASDGTFNYFYDNNGALIRQMNIATGAETDYTYNNRGRQTSVTDKDGSGTITQVIGYTYDVFGQLIARSVTPYTGGIAGTPTVENFVRDPATGNIVLQFDGSGNITDRNLWGPGVNQILADEQVTSPTTPGTVYWALPDNQGSVKDVINSSGTLENHTASDPFGNVVPALSSAAVDFIFGQDGEFTDPLTGQVFAENRVYDPWIDRWDRSDPLGLAPGPNDYEYVGNGPTNHVDPSGRFAVAAAVVTFVIYYFWPDTANAPAPGDRTYPSNKFEGMPAAAASGAGAGALYRAFVPSSSPSRRDIICNKPPSRFTGLTNNALNKTINAEQHALLRRLFKGETVKGLTRESLEAAAELSRRVIQDGATSAAQRAVHAQRLEQILKALNNL